MKQKTTKCPFCPKEFAEDSEALYWHIKIHKATGEATSQQIDIKPTKYFPDDTLNKPSSCMHENCAGCKAGTCKGVHMMSCPCPNCSIKM